MFENRPHLVGLVADGDGVLSPGRNGDDEREAALVVLGELDLLRRAEGRS